MALVRKRRRLQRQGVDSKQVKATVPYTGPEVIGRQRNEDPQMFVAIENAPDHPQFPKLMPGCYPPKTWYVFNPETGYCDGMYSLDDAGVGISWDSDYSGRYFTRVTQPLQCPRYVEWAYDSSKALEAGESFTPSHPSYRGSLSSAVSARKSQPDRRHAPRDPITPRVTAGGATAGKNTTPHGVKGNVIPRPVGRRPKFKRADNAPDQLSTGTSTALTNQGMDKRRVDATAADMASELTAAFDKPGKRRPIRRKRV